MRLLAIGDSYTYGAELDSQERFFLSWPGRLSANLNKDATNYGEIGASNEYCLRRMFEYTSSWLSTSQDPADLLVAIGWTHCGRREFFTSRGDYLKYFVGYKTSGYSSKEVNFMDQYKKRSGSPVCEARLSLQIYLSAQSYLKSFGFPYLFFQCAWPTPVENSNMATLIDKRRFYGFGEERKSMHAWLIDREYQFMDGAHPGKEGHEAWARELQSFIEAEDLLQSP